MTSPSTAPTVGEDSLLSRFTMRAQQWRLGPILGLLVVIGAPLSGIATYGVLATAGAEGVSTDTAVTLLAINLGLLATLAALITVQIMRLVAARRRGAAGSRLHLRLVSLFAMIAVAPAIAVAIFSAITINLGVQTWFSERVSGVVDNSLVVAEAYLKEHRQVIEADVLAMANDLNRAAPLYLSNPRRFAELVATQAAIRALPEAYVIDGTGRVLARSSLSLSPNYQAPSPANLEAAQSGDVVTLTSDQDSQVRALVRLPAFVDAYLYVARFIDPRALVHLRDTQEAVEIYRNLEGKRTGLQTTFAVLYLIFALLVLLAAVSVGLWIANRFATPVRQLINAADAVGSGDFSARVPEIRSGDEFEVLSRTFNRMTSQILGQHNELIDKTRQIDERRRFMEIVLTGVTAGVIGTDGEGRIRIANRSAQAIFGLHSDAMIGRLVGEVLAPLTPIIEAARKTDVDMSEAENIQIKRSDGVRDLVVRVTRELEGDNPGFVITVDDVTRLMAAQRMAAWGDVARRIAHEIKNPLTPIQLSAERLKRRYAKSSSPDQAVLEQCTDTIIRQVGDIRRMVDEFSSFARMPEPIFREENLAEIAHQAVFLQQMGNPRITFGMIAPDHPVVAVCDGRLISQAMTNLLKNAAEAIDERIERQDDAETNPGLVRLIIEETGTNVAIKVVDNGSGLAAEVRDRVTEPYVTTRAKGTGLGLAIVQKIAAEHGGNVTLADARSLDPEWTGACATMTLRKEGPAEERVQKVAPHD